MKNALKDERGQQGKTRSVGESQKYEAPTGVDSGYPAYVRTLLFGIDRKRGRALAKIEGHPHRIEVSLNDVVGVADSADVYAQGRKDEKEAIIADLAADFEAVHGEPPDLRPDDGAVA